MRRLKRMLYAVEPLGSGRWFSTSDPYVVAAEASRGGLLGYCTALELLGVVEPSGLPLTTLIPRPTKEYEIGGHRHIQYLTPKALRDSGQEDLGVVRVPRNGTWIPCTGLERTVIDILQRSDRAGGLGWAITTLVAVAHCIGAYSGTQAGHACRPRPTDQTIPCTNPIPRTDSAHSADSADSAHSAHSAHSAVDAPAGDDALCEREGMVRSCRWGPWRFNPDILLEYLELLGVQRAWALTGYYLTRFQSHLGISPETLKLMVEQRTGSRQYWVRGERGGMLDKRWNIIVPPEVVRAFKGRVGLVEVNSLHPRTGE